MATYVDNRIYRGEMTGNLWINIKIFVPKQALRWRKQKLF